MRQGNIDRDPNLYRVYQAAHATAVYRAQPHGEQERQAIMDAWLNGANRDRLIRSYNKGREDGNRYYSIFFKE